MSHKWVSGFIRAGTDCISEDKEWTFNTFSIEPTDYAYGKKKKVDLYLIIYIYQNQLRCL